MALMNERLTTASTSKHTKQDWLNLIKEWEDSALTQKQFCQRKGLVLSHFVYRRAYQKKKLAPSPQQEKKSFLPVKILSEQEACSKGQEAFMLFLPNGLKLSIPAQYSASSLSTLLHVLREAQ